MTVCIKSIDHNGLDLGAKVQTEDSLQHTSPSIHFYSPTKDPGNANFMLRGLEISWEGKVKYYLGASRNVTWARNLRVFCMYFKCSRINLI